MDKNELVNLSITSLASEGVGIGRHDGMAVFVPYTAPGDEICARVVKVRKNCAFGRVEKMLTPSPDRIAPDCPVFGKCGGCAMRRIGRIDLDPEPILGADQPDGYRNKAQYPVSRADGKLLAGFYAPRSHRVIDCRTCRLQPKDFEMALVVFDAYMQTYNISCYDEQTGRGLLRHIYLRRAEATGEVMACAVINGNALPHSDALVTLLRQAVPGLTSVCLNINRERTNVILGNRCKTLWGGSFITDVLCGNRIRISPLSFYQVNRTQAERLYGKVRDYLNPDGTQTVLDLYCGAGTIGLSLARSVRQVIGAEIVEQAVADAQVNAQLNGIANARFFCADAGEAAARLEREGIRPDAVIVDPPRKGCSEELLRVITSMAPDKLIYVSCDPATLARDCARLSADGWRVVSYTPVDLFPRTAHCETVAELVWEERFKDEGSP